MTALALTALLALLMCHASPALLLIGGRLAETCLRLVGAADPNAAQVNKTGERSHRAALTVQPFLTTYAVVPGLVLFAVILWNFLSPGTIDLDVTKQAIEQGYGIQVLSGAAAVNALSALLLGPRRELGSMWRYDAVKMLNIALLAAAAGYAWSVGFDPLACLLGMLVVILPRTGLLIFMHGRMLYGTACLLWLPFAVLAVVLRAIAIAVLGPLIFVGPRWLRGNPAAGAFGIGAVRQNEISQGHPSRSRSASLDSIRGAFAPA